MKKLLMGFFFPKLNRFFFIRLGLLILVTVLACKFIITPAFTNGVSMLPTYASGKFLPVWRPAYWFSSPQVGDVVMVRFAGDKVMLLKRVVATAGQTVEFRKGVLHVDGQPCQEYWSSLTPCDWELPPRVVPPGEVYVIGDNRAMPMETHVFGHVAIRRITGKALW